MKDQGENVKVCSSIQKFRHVLVCNILLLLLKLPQEREKEKLLECYTTPNLQAKHPSPGILEAFFRAIMDCSIPVCREHMTSMLRATVRDISIWEQLMVTGMIVFREVESVHWLRGF